MTGFLLFDSVQYQSRTITLQIRLGGLCLTQSALAMQCRAVPRRSVFLAAPAGSTGAELMCRVPTACMHPCHPCQPPVRVAKIPARHCGVVALVGGVPRRTAGATPPPHQLRRVAVNAAPPLGADGAHVPRHATRRSGARPPPRQPERLVAPGLDFVSVWYGGWGGGATLRGDEPPLLPLRKARRRRDGRRRGERAARGRRGSARRRGGGRLPSDSSFFLRSFSPTSRRLTSRRADLPAPPLPLLQRACN